MQRRIWVEINSKSSIWCFSHYFSWKIEVNRNTNSYKQTIFNWLWSIIFYLKFWEGTFLSQRYHCFYRRCMCMTVVSVFIINILVYNLFCLKSSVSATKELHNKLFEIGYRSCSPRTCIFLPRKYISFNRLQTTVTVVFIVTFIGYRDQQLSYENGTKFP